MPSARKSILMKPCVVAGILVPLAQHPTLPGSGLQGHDLHQGAARDDHAAHVLGDVAGKALDVVGQLTERLPQR